MWVFPNALLVMLLATRLAFAQETTASGTTTEAIADTLTGAAIAGSAGSPVPAVAANIQASVGGSENITFNGGRRNNAQNFGYSPSNDYDKALAQQFTPTLNDSTATVTLSLATAGSPNDNVVASIQADASGLPSGTDLVTASVAGSLLTGSFVNTVFPSMTVSLTAGVKYWVVMTRSGSEDASNYYGVALWQGGSDNIARLNTSGDGPGWHLAAWNGTVVGSISLTSATSAGSFRGAASNGKEPLRPSGESLSGGPTTASGPSTSCLLYGPAYKLASDTVEWSMTIGSGQSCVRGIRTSFATIDNIKLITPPQSGRVTLEGWGFVYKGDSNFRGEDSFAILLSGKINKVSGSSRILVVVSVR